ncbi:MAG: ABC transporter permease [Myxococcaceae bacterium]
MSHARIDFLEGGRIAVTSLRSNRLRTVLTTVGVGVGVATLLAIIGIIQGLNRSFADQLSSLGATSLYVSKFPWVMRGEWFEYRNRQNLTLAQGAKIKEQCPLVTAISPEVGRVADVAFLDQQATLVRVTGTTADYLQVSGFELTAGRFLTDADDANAKAVVVLGADVVDLLFPKMDPTGQSVRIDGKPFRVIGTLSRKGKILNEPRDLKAVIPFHTFLGYFGKRRGLSLGVAVARPEDLNEAEDQIVGILRRARGTPPDKADDFSINRPEMLANTYKQLTGALYGVAVGVGLITLLVGGIGIMNIMLVSVRERTREIGVRRALGARKRTIIVQFLLEAATVSAVGGALGTAVGMGAAALVSELTPLAASVEPLTIAFGIGFAAVVGLLFGIWPAARAANLDPVEALRYE